MFKVLPRKTRRKRRSKNCRRPFCARFIGTEHDFAEWRCKLKITTGARKTSAIFINNQNTAAVKYAFGKYPSVHLTVLSADQERKRARHTFQASANVVCK